MIDRREILDMATKLGSQFTALPPVETFLAELPAFFKWLEAGATPLIRIARLDAFAPALPLYRRADLYL